MKIALIGNKLGILFANGLEKLHHALADAGFERGVITSREFLLRLADRFTRESGINRKQIAYTRLVGGKLYLVAAVGDGALEFAHDGIFVVKQENGSRGVVVRLAHFGGGVQKRVDFRARLG